MMDALSQKIIKQRAVILFRNIAHLGISSIPAVRSYDSGTALLHSYIYVSSFFKEHLISVNTAQSLVDSL